MRPTEILKEEHRVIEQVLDALEALAGQASRAGRLDAPAAQDALEFFRIFADKVHHGKEEAHLFPAMEAKGFPRHGGPTGVMLAEHDEGRGHVRAMAAQIEPASAGDAAAIETFGTHASAFARLLREHIHKEDHCLFGMADSAFTESDQTLLMAAFDRAEREEIEGGLRERGLELARRLTAEFGAGCKC